MMMAEFVQLRISLNNIEPEIWRRIIVPGNLNLHELHGLLQGAMGWENSHLYDYVVGDKRYELPERDALATEGGSLDAREVRLDKTVSVGESILYRYDFGDGWTHTVTRERLTRPIPSVFFVGLCLEGANACPPEDVGGEPGYERHLTDLKKGKGDAYRNAISWRGAFDPKLFSPAQATQAMSMFAVMMNLRREGFDWF
ncbi:plasmid pRiA4b ORF-3 family protein [Hyphomonas sp. UBA1923]|uniref:plasmid pRiA4b ORF-3 family protein n=1 Tax=Hyphomonas sp. UBA1923 TaxID=1946617 RepID=UPI0025C5EBCC|nr:plasmid pRiA4b ORF-3 family protein [Hyphomonas sp. UBA1923]